MTRNGELEVHYTYDSNGNRLIAEGVRGTFAATYDSQDRLLTYGGTSYTYTANGELLTRTVGDQITSYEYDALGNLRRVRVPSGTDIQYLVDGRNRRVAKLVNGVRVRAWIYGDQLRPIAELEGSGAVVARFVYGTRANAPDYMVRFRWWSP